jgi:hypothetical protein
MEDKAQEIPSEKPNFGIKTLTKIKKPKSIQHHDLEKNALNLVYQCFSGPRIVKAEFTITAIFLLFCIESVNLADGKLMAQGKDFGFVKEVNGKKTKEFEEIKFRVTDRDINVTIVSIAAGDEHVIALDFERNVWGWGNNKNKQINPYMDDLFFKRFVRLEYLKSVIFGVNLYSLTRK